MSRDVEKSRLFTRRSILISGMQMGLLSLLCGRLYYLQITQSERYNTLADDNRISLRLVPPKRGRILDRAGTPVAVNQKNYRLVFMPEQVEDLDLYLMKISRYLPIDHNDRKRIEKDIKSQNRYDAVLVLDNLTWDQVATVSLHMPDLIGSEIEEGELRSYPFSEMFAHLVGYVGLVSQEDKEKGHKAVPGFRIGKNGVERQYDHLLRGSPGEVQLEVNARGRVVRELAKQEPIPGRDVTLTIDQRIQEKAYSCLRDMKSGAAVVLDIYSGAIYALASAPGYDPNHFAYGISQQEWSSLIDNEYVPLLNKAIDGLYAPGSTFKIVTALAGLEAGLISAKDSVFCPGYVDLGNHRFHCWKKGGHGHVDFIHAMAGSCDTFFYDVGKRVGIDRIYQVAKKLGLGDKTGVDFPHERSGVIPNRTWKLATKGTSWQQGETLISAIGQGYILATPVQLAIMIARIANGGYEVSPHLLKTEDQHSINKPVGRTLGFETKHIQLIQEALNAVVNLPIGTAHEARIREEGLSMAGKTGTSQVRRITTAERSEGVLSNDELPWKERDHALFVGYGPVEKPRYAAAVIVEHGGSGAHVAAPIVRDILSACQAINPAQE